MIPDGEIGMVVVDGVRYRPEEAKAFGLEATESVPVEDVTPVSRKLTAEQQARLEEIFEGAEALEAERDGLLGRVEALEAERDGLLGRVEALEAERDQLKEQIVALEKLAEGAPSGDKAAASAPSPGDGAKAAADAVSTATAQPGNKARSTRGKSA